MKASNINEIQTTIVEEVAKHFKDGEHEVNIFAMPARQPLANQFVMVFVENLLLSIDDYDLSKNDIRVLLKITSLMKFGNLVHVSWASIGSDLGISSKNISRNIKNLKDAKLLIEYDGNTYLNPQIIAKGKFLRKQGDNSLSDILRAGKYALEGTNLKESIVEKNEKIL